MKHTLIITAPWKFTLDGIEFTVPSPAQYSVCNELMTALPVYQAKAGWNNGTALKLGQDRSGAMVIDALEPDSVRVCDSTGHQLARGIDYDFDDRFATLGRLENGAIGTDAEVKVAYDYTPMRVDSVFAAANGNMRYEIGIPAGCCPELPSPQPGETRLLNIFLDRKTEKLEPRNLFLVQSTAAVTDIAVIRRQRERIPRTLAKLARGEKIRILAWGDSVTEGSYLPENERWQNQFIVTLRQMYPQADIELLSHGWPGYTVTAFLGEPSGSRYNFAETVLAHRPDLIISEFVNDAHLEPEEWPKSFPRVRDAFREIGAEWIILTPHYIRNDWMGLTCDNGEALDHDPREFVRWLRDFAENNQIALADASRHYGQLWRQGIPHLIYMVNCINHPDRRGMKIFADALEEIFKPSQGKS